MQNIIQEHNKKLAAQISSSYHNVVDYVSNEEIQKAHESLSLEEKNDLMKGKPAVPVGTKKDISGRTYIKTINGWKYFGKGTGTKAQEHHSNVKGGGVAVHEGSHIINDQGLSGKVIHHDEKETHIEYKDKDGKTQVSKQSTDDFHKRVGEGKLTHAISAEEAGKGGFSITGSGMRAEEKIATDEHYDINKRFKAFELFTQGVIEGKMKSLIAYGTGGVGKTYTVTNELKKAGKIEYNEDKMTPGDKEYDWVKVTGKSTPTAVWKELYQHNDKIIVFDDNDAVLQNNDAINFFKGALDTSGDGTISYGTTKKLVDDAGNELPNRFKFTGKVIFISNLSPDKVPQPLKSRGYSVDLSMNKQQTMNRLKTIATTKEGKLQNLQFPGIKDYSHEDMKEVLDHLSHVKDKMKADLSVRTIAAMLGIKQMSDQLGDDWKEHASHMLFSKSENSIQMENKNSRQVYDGSMAINSRRKQILKSYGAIEENIAPIQKSEEVKSLEHKDFEEKSNHTKTEVEKALEVLNLDNNDGDAVSFEKGGEGSKGGQVIGHTQSGKPIYSNHNPHAGHKFEKWSKQDHKDAASMHKKMSDMHQKQADKHWEKWTRNADEVGLAQSKHHIAEMDKHESAKKGHEYAAENWKFDKKAKLIPSNDNHVTTQDNVEIHSTKPLKKSEEDELKRGENDNMGLKPGTYNIKDETLFEKGQIADRIAYGYGGDAVKFVKTGKEIKDKIPSILALLAVKKAEVEAKMGVLKTNAGVEPLSNYWTDPVANVSIMRYEWKVCEDVASNNDNKSCNDYNEWCYVLRDIIEDINALSVITNNMKDDAKYNLSVGQLVALQFN